MITIEVLISMLILFMVVATSIGSMKHLQQVQNQQMRYEDIYIAVENIKDFIANDICIDKSQIKGQMLGFTYVAICTKVKALRNYQKPFELGEPEGNFGRELVTYFRIKLSLKRDKLSKNFLYSKTTVQKAILQ